jgi:DsbC/DsbD-like thiol-disulfide interchange protein
MDTDARILLTRRTLVGGMGAACLSEGSVFAQSLKMASWADGVSARLDLIGGGKTGAYYNAGLHIAMRPGFKTYWRMPGDTGVPPQFNFESSVNLKQARVLFPLPLRFADGAGGTSIGYPAPDVLFPVQVEALDPSRPVELHVKADYAVCERMCIPVSGEARLILSAASQHSARIGAAQARVPVAAKLGGSRAPAIRSISRGKAAESLIVEVAVPEGAAPDLFVEAPSPWFFETRAFVPMPGGGRFEIVAIERNKAVDCAGVDLVLTLAAGEKAIEVATWLDAALLAS